VTDKSRPFRAEIEDIIMNHSNTRFGEVARGVKKGLTDADMAEEAQAKGQPIRADSIAAVRRILRMTFDDELVTAPSDAEEQANVFRELLNHRCSEGLLQHIATRLTRLQAIGPNVKKTPLGAGHLGSNSSTQTERLGPLCPQCFQFHNGECQ
jgi:hypothetical protein